MAAQNSSKAVPAKRRGWLRRIGRWVLWTVLVVVLLHRPIVHFGGRWVAIRLAKKEHMDLDLRIGGNLWSGLEVRDVAIRDDGTGLAPVERLKLDRLAVSYDLWKALRGDWARVLRRVDVGSLDGVIVLQEPDPNKPVEPPAPFAKIFQEILSNSLSPVEQLKIARVDLELKDVVVVRGFQLEVDRQKPGSLGWEGIEVVNVPKIGPVRTELAAGESSFALGRISIFPHVVVTRLSLNRVTDALPRGGLEVAAEVGGGTVDIRVEPSLAAGAIDAAVDVKAVRVNEVAALFRVELPMPAFIDGFQAKFTGAPEQPGSSTAAVNFSGHADKAAGFPGATIRCGAKWESGTFSISELLAGAPGMELRVAGSVTVPQPKFDPARLSGEFGWKIEGPDLSQLPLGEGNAIHGALTGAGSVRLQNGEALMAGDIAASKLAQSAIRVDEAKIHLEARRKPGSWGDILTSVAATLSADVRGITANGIRVDAFSLKASLADRRVRIEQLEVTSGENRISGSGSAMLKPGFEGFAGSPEIDVRIAAPRVDQFGIAVNRAALSGTVSGEAGVRLDGTQLAGNLQVSGADLRLGKAPIGGFAADVKFEKGAAVVDSLSIRLGDAGEIVAKGRVGLEEPWAYGGELKAKLGNLGMLNPIIEAVGQTAKLGGALTLEWTGDGQFASGAHNGKLTLLGKDLRSDAIVVNEVRFGATYSPRQAETNEFLLVADKTRLAGRLEWKDDRLRVSELVASVAGEQVFTGEASVPLAPGGPNGLFPPDQPISVHLNGRNLDLPRLFSRVGMVSPISGKVSIDLGAGGTLAKPDFKLSVEARALKSEKAVALAPADVDLKAGLSDSRLTVAVVAKQKDIQPLTMNASVPMDLEKVLAEPAGILELPLQIALKLPATSLGVVPRLVPDISKLDGTVAADLSVGGTIAKPIMNGEISMAIKSIRLASEDVPPVANFSSKLILRDEAITFKDTRGEVGGGSFGLEGTVKLAQPGQPEFDLRLRSNKVLVLRNDAITVRADTDLTLKGRLNAATAAGTVFVTQSRFFKDVDILPLALPGRAKPQVRSVARPARVSFPNPPLRDWKFDIAIKTRENDSFLVRGNLAKGAAAIALRLGGTGLNPFLTGHVQIENFSAVLPVSTLEVKRGFVTFSEDDPFQPQLDIQAESRIRKNTVMASISGSATAPRMELDSSPPLPQKDILSLLATGTTTGEVGSNASALATKAALLTVKRWYRRTFRGGANGNGNGDAGGKGEESLLERFEMDVGNVDPKTGRPDVTGSLRINDNLYFLGDIDMGGQVTGKVKYLLRFR
jgi:hypothetical protein